MKSEIRKSKTTVKNSLKYPFLAKHKTANGDLICLFMDRCSCVVVVANRDWNVGYFSSSWEFSESEWKILPNDTEIVLSNS